MALACSAVRVKGRPGVMKADADRQGASRCWVAAPMEVEQMGGAFEWVVSAPVAVVDTPLGMARPRARSPPVKVRGCEVETANTGLGAERLAEVDA